MRLQVLAVGRLKAGPERDLVARYRGRIEAMARASGISSCELSEIPEGRERQAPDRQASEAGALLARTGQAALVAFDERGKSLSSEEFAGRLGAWRDAGTALAFAIGGADGLHTEIRDRAELVLSFGRLTLPHQLVRILVLEQIYRALTILSGHPYHRGDPGRD